MASLLDIGPLTETVVIRGVSLDVSGVSAGDLFKLITKFPEFRKLIGGGSSADITPDKLVSLGSDVAAVIIAMVTGQGGNKEVEEKARGLSAGEQMAIVSKAFALTFTEGVAKFVEQLTTLAAGITGPQTPQTNSSENSQDLSLAQFISDVDLGPKGPRGISRRVN